MTNSYIFSGNDTYVELTNAYVNFIKSSEFHQEPANATLYEHMLDPQFQIFYLALYSKLVEKLLNTEKYKLFSKNEMIECLSKIISTNLLEDRSNKKRAIEISYYLGSDTSKIFSSFVDKAFNDVPKLSAYFHQWSKEEDPYSDLSINPNINTIGMLEVNDFNTIAAYAINSIMNNQALAHEDVDAVAHEIIICVASKISEYVQLPQSAPQPIEQ